MQLLLVLLLAVATQAYDVIEGEFLLGLRPENDVDVFSAMLRRDFNLELKKVWDMKRTKILWVTGDAADALRAKALPEVKYMDYNGWARADQCSSTSHPGVWGLDRTDQREPLPYSLPTSPDAVYNHGLDTGAGVTVYVTDTGIDITHSTFEGRAVWGYTADGMTGTVDDNGHGTHCAGTIGGLDYGVAKGVTMSAVKVLDENGSGPWTSIIDGLAWIDGQHTAGASTVVSMSLGGTGENTALEDQINIMIGNGISFSVSAGNSNVDACFQAPAYIAGCVTVGATDVSDISADFTNFGTCVDIFAPGVQVLSAQPDSGEAYFSGTSMSAPHVAGVMARYMSSGLDNSPAAVADWLTAQATVNAITWSDNRHDSSPNLMLYADCVL
jgi:subtilisin family serine protease